MAITKEQLKEVIGKIESKEARIFLYATDAEQYDDSVRFTYKFASKLNELGYAASIVHQKTDFKCEWAEEYVDIEKLKFKYFEAGEFDIRMEDFFFLPEEASHLMPNIMKAPCKNVIVVHNWFKVLQALEPGTYWDTYRLTTAITLSEPTTDYIKMVMPFASVATITGSVDADSFPKPESTTDKRMQVAYVASRDGGNKSNNAIKSFYALYPYLRFISFLEVSKMDKKTRSTILQESAFFVSFDEYNTWPTYALEAINSGCLICGWDGLGATNVLNTETAIIVPNGDVVRISLAMGSLVEEYLLHNVPEERIKAAEEAAGKYSDEAELKSFDGVISELFASRIGDIEKYISNIKEEVKDAE